MQLNGSWILAAVFSGGQKDQAQKFGSVKKF